MTHTDTICAPSTAPAAACRGIVRVSGNAATRVVAQIADDAMLSHATAVPATLDLALGSSVPATLYVFLAPRSSTGEDVVEIHLPGSPLLVGRLLDRLYQLGIRAAEPGEFTARAFFNGKLGLSAAEGVAATIGASNRAELDAARSLLAGELARRLTPALDALVSLLAAVETDVDFVEEDVSTLDTAQTRKRIDAVIADLRKLLAESPTLERLAHEPRIVLVGRPNAGKSTLINWLAGEERAVISPTAGTTRDALSARVVLPSGTVTLVDIAGLEASDAPDSVDEQMAAVAGGEVARADRIVYVREKGDARPPIEVGRLPDLVVASKSDQPSEGSSDGLRVSAKAGDGLASLLDALDAIAFPSATADAGSALALNGRHILEINRAIDAARQAHDAADDGVELVASALRRSVDHLGRVLGSVSPDDVLGRIFSSFCIGK